MKSWILHVEKRDGRFYFLSLNIYFFFLSMKLNNSISFRSKSYYQIKPQKRRIIRSIFWAWDLPKKYFFQFRNGKCKKSIFPEKFIPESSLWTDWFANSECSNLMQNSRFFLKNLICQCDIERTEKGNYSWKRILTKMEGEKYPVAFGWLVIYHKGNIQFA